MKSSFRILFYGRTNEQRKDGTMPLTARVTINGETVAFNIKMSVPVAIWDGKSSRAKGRSPEATRINRYLESINSRLISLYQNLTEAGEIVTPQILHDEFLGVGVRSPGCDCAEILRLIEAGEIDTTPLIMHRYKLADIEAAYHFFENKLDGVTKVAVEP